MVQVVESSILEVWVVCEISESAGSSKRRTITCVIEDDTCSTPSFKRLRLPIGSGVTEAACKTVFTQRLKLSGMTWGKPGAQTILNLRVILLSGLWEDVYTAVLATLPLPRIVTPTSSSPITQRKPRRKCA